SVSTIAQSVVTINTVNVPTLATRSASTTVELGSGESFAIAGLLQNNSTNTIDKFPWLGDVPILGTLFRSNQFRNDESELVIIVTPYIIKPVKNASKLVTPSEGMEEPNDVERIIGGRLYSPKENKGRDSSEVMNAPVAKLKIYGNPGYITE